MWHAYSFGYLVPSHFGLAHVQLLEINSFSELVIIFLDYAIQTYLGTFSILPCIFRYRFFNDGIPDNISASIFSISGEVWFYIKAWKNRNT